MELQDFTAIIQQLCKLHNASITSWIRTTKHNTQVGGHPNSKHLTGLAADLLLDDHRQAPQLINRAKALGLTAINEGDHVHIQTKRAS